MRVAKTAFLLLILALPLMIVTRVIGGLAAIPADAFYLAAAAALAAAVLTGRARLQWDPLYFWVLLYFAAMALSAVTAADPQRAWFKLATQVYLLSLPLLTASLVTSERDMRNVFRAWLATTAVICLLATITVVSFFLTGGKPLAAFAMHPFGTLPPGFYPRIQATFVFPAMLCNYLSISLAILLISLQRKWIGRRAFWIVLVPLLVTAWFSLTPGLGGIFLLLGIFGWALLKGRARSLALAAGVIAAVLFLLSAPVTPILHPTAPFLIHVPGTDRVVAPSVRMMVWIDSFRTFLAHPLTGVGVGGNSAYVAYVTPSGELHFPMTDAHNVFLDVAAQCGLLGLVTLIALIFHVGRRTFPLDFSGRQGVRRALGAAWLCAFAYQGLTGSYQDARHLWLVLGLMVAAQHLEKRGPAAA